MKERILSPIAIVTGGMAGIGAATASRFLRDGYDVAIWDKQVSSEDDGNLTKGRTGSGRTLLRHVDVANADSVENALRGTLEVLGIPTVLVNCAGVLGETVHILDLDASSWHRVLDINLTGAFYCTQAVAREMVGNTAGSIVNVISVAAFTSFPHRNAYAASKAGLLGLTRSSALDLAQHQIRVNGVAPGVIETSMSSQSGWTDGRDVAPLSRKGTTGEIAGAIAFLAGPDSSYITGEVITVDGGRSVDG